MEHSWITNRFVGQVERLLSRKGSMYKSRLVWGGDYADNEPKRNDTLYGICDIKEETELKPKLKYIEYRFIVNHTKKQFVDKTKAPVTSVWTNSKTKKEYPMRVHPLPLLTCESNGHGGGDYFSDIDKDLVGTWNRDVISVSHKQPKGYTELIVQFKEEQN